MCILLCSEQGQSFMNGKRFFFSFKECNKTPTSKWEQSSCLRFKSGTHYLKSCEVNYSLFRKVTLKFWQKVYSLVVATQDVKISQALHWFGMQQILNWKLSTLIFMIEKNLLYAGCHSSHPKILKRNSATDVLSCLNMY